VEIGEIGDVQHVIQFSRVPDNHIPEGRASGVFLETGRRVGRPQLSPSPGSAGAHGARLPIKMVNIVTDHPITKGLPKEWLHTADELYARMRGPGENMTVLSTAYSDPANKGTGCDEPMLIVLSYGKGRVFHTLLGHDLAALNCVGFMTTYQRGTEWAATGKVTQKVPDDFPTADKTSMRKTYEEHDPNLPQVACSPQWDALRSEPGFRDILRRMNLPQ
jgi:hypothetical protein